MGATAPVRSLPHGHADELSRLRELLLGETRGEIEQLVDRLDDRHRRAAETGEILPRAIAQHAESRALSRALEPQVDAVLERVVRRNPQRIIDVLSPIVGRTVRRAIRDGLADIVQRLNQTVEHSLTLKGVKMRIEAARTGIPFPEVVLRHALLYRVEQLFVVHRETGLLLAKAVDEDVATRDPELVSSMLTVVQDFVRDSLDVNEDEALDSVKVGDLSIWVEPGSNVILAAVIRGTPPVQLRNRLSDLLDDLQAQYRRPLEAFDGDLAPFAMMPDELEVGLASQRSDENSRMGFALFLLVLLTLGAVWMFASARADQSRFDQLVDQLDAQPGIMVTSARRVDGAAQIRGLRLATSADPSQFAEEIGHDPASIDFRWETLPSAVGAQSIQNSPQWIASAEQIRGSVVQYDWESAALTPDAATVVDGVANALQTMSSGEAKPLLVIRAHIDDVGPNGVNEDLRLERAQSVAIALRDRGVSPGQVAIQLIDPTTPEETGRWIGFEILG